ncbi:cysteine dioxygenase [Bordetella sp. 02P26C-1]|uniref:cysteine dioxygenase family protein n=1 Tax=Bordetella sp. 02P26C-1 TaxID=2683195 RepID=UPI001353DF0C|nr:cysteine dioxygenase [Bordetella sp. 02P26C-1]MVW77821.1 cysteine dioxygenase [Bordetella sp. 02P26C-1]
MFANLGRLRAFVAEATLLADRHGSSGMAGPTLQAALADLVAHDDWLPESCAAPHPEYYQQHLLHCDPLERFSLVSFVWGPGQSTPVHDHAVWGYVAMLRGSEFSQRYLKTASACVPDGAPTALQPGQIDVLSPLGGDIHRVWNACEDAVSISIHLYGGNIGAIARHVFDPDTGQTKPFVSGYSSAHVPNLWDRSAEVRLTLK